MSTVKGRVIIFGSGESTISGSKILRKVFKTYPYKQNIAVLETSAGFQPNSDVVAGEIKNRLKESLNEFIERIVIVPARTREGKFSVNNYENLEDLENYNFILLGPGSPTYCARILKNSLLLNQILVKWNSGDTLCISSAAAMAFSKFILPVYEIYKAGFDLYWVEGLDVFKNDLFENLAIIPHFNNNEGGAKLDTSHCFMGKERFDRLHELLPKDAVILAIDENTAVEFDFERGRTSVIGNGNAYIFHDNQTHILSADKIYDLETLKRFELEIVEDHEIQDIFYSTVQKNNVLEKLKSEDYPEIIRDLASKREEAKKTKNYGLADSIRNEISELGYIVTDTAEGQVLSRK